MLRLTMHVLSVTTEVVVPSHSTDSYVNVIGEPFVVGDDQLTLTLLSVLDVVTVRGASGLNAQSSEMLLEYAL